MITFNCNKISLKPGARVLDIGCGSGRHATAVYQRWKAWVLAADTDLDDLKIAGQRLAWHHDNGFHRGGTWQLAASDVTALPFASGCFDLVICSEVLEHVPDHGRAVAEITRVTKPGGQVVVSVPRNWPEKLCWKLAPDYARSPGGHIRIYRLRKLQAMLEKSGLNFESHHHAHSLHTAFWWLKCLLGLENSSSRLLQFYKGLLDFYVLRKPRVPAALEKLLDPVLGKSLVLYFRKPSPR